MVARALSRTSSSLLLLSLLGAGCTRPPAQHPARPDPTPVDPKQLAAELDDPAAAPLWPLVRADLRALVAARVPSGLTPATRLRVGTDWLNAENLLESCDGREPHESLLKFLTGYAILEELAWSPTSDRRGDAIGVLYDRLRAEPFSPDLRPTIRRASAALTRAGVPPDRQAGRAEALRCRGPTIDLITAHAAALERHFAAELLRAPPSERTVRVLRNEADRLTETHAFQKALPIYLALSREAPGDSGTWLALAGARYRTDRLQAGDEALKRGGELAGDKNGAELREARRLQALARRLDASQADDLAPSVARVWTLFEMDRLDEAQALAASVRRRSPNDARAFLADVALRCYTQAPGDLVAAVRTASTALAEAQHLTHREADYDRFQLSIALQDDLFTLFGLIATPSSEAARARERAAATRARRLLAELGPHLPDDAPLFQFVFDLLHLMPTSSPAPDGLMRQLGEQFPRALALYTAHPSPVSYRMMLALAPLAPDHGAAYAAITAPLRFDPRADDHEIAVARARAFLTTAWRARDTDGLAAFPTLIADASRTSDGDDSEVGLLRTDLYMLRLVRGGPGTWREIGIGYADVASDLSKGEGYRASNNWLAIVDHLRPGDGTDEGWWFLLTQTNDHLMWPLLTNAAVAAWQAGRRDRAIAILQSRRLDKDEHRPDFVEQWLVCLTGSAAPVASSGASPALMVVDAGSFSELRLNVGSWLPGQHPPFTLRVQSAPWLVASPQRCWASRSTATAGRD